jgi:hypothetical protein
MGPALRKINEPISAPVIEIKKPIRIISFKDLDFTNLVISNKEDVTLIWFDENINKRDDLVDTKLLLQTTNNYVLHCADKETCLRTIELIKNEKIILVLSGKCARDILEQIHSYEKIDSIFIFCYRSERYDFLRNQFSKLVNIHKCHEKLFADLNEQIKQLRSHLEAFSLFNPKTHLRHLTATSAEFLWFLLLKNALMRLPINTSPKTEMINQCRSYYRNNSKQLEDIAEFEKTYHSSDAIYWYSRSLFVSHLVNKALRTEDMDLLYLFRFFIIDLSQNLRLLAAAQSSIHNEILHLKRGLTLSNDEIDEILSNIGNYISPNGFMSASRCSEVANIFGTNVIFEIEVDTRLNICANIEKLSAFPDEREVLFDLGSVFRIDDVYFDKEIKRWLVKITAIPDGEQFTENVLQLNNIDRPEIFFGELIYLTGHYDQAYRYLSRLKQEHLREKSMPINQEQFLKMKTKCNQYIRKISDNKQLIESISTLVMIAEIYQMTGNNIKAMEHLETALNALAIASTKKRLNF